jgi:carbon-monoxide dehydrogenase medium subunit
MLLAATDYVRPDSLQEACELLASTANSRPLAGGQSLLNVLKHRAASVDLLVDISRLEELRSIDAGGDAVTVGAGVTYAELEHSDALRASHPVVSEVASVTARSAIAAPSAATSASRTPHRTSRRSWSPWAPR